jgi:hypothetical protein
MDSSDYSTCEICDNYEICLCSQAYGNESGLYICKGKEHVFCCNCISKTKLKQVQAAWEENDYGVPSEFCPICSRKFVTDEDLLKFLLTKVKMTKSQAIKDFRTEK